SFVNVSREMLVCLLMRMTWTLRMTASVESVTEPDTNPRVSCAFRGAAVPNKKSKKILGFFGDCAPKKWPCGQIGPRAISEKARSAISRQPSASDQHSALIVLAAFHSALMGT